MDNRWYLIIVVIVLLGCSTSKQNEESDESKSWIIKPEKFGLKKISTGVDSIQIRIWYSHAFATFIPVLTIEKAEGAWRAALRTVILDFQNDSAVVKRIKIKTLTPKFGWPHFLKKLDSLKIYTLPDMHTIPNVEDGYTDGSSYSFEIAKAKFYRTYNYHLPDNFQNKFWQAKNVVEILKEIEVEFDIPWNTNSGNRWKEFVDNQLK